MHKIINDFWTAFIIIFINYDPMFCFSTIEVKCADIIKLFNKNF